MEFKKDEACGTLKTCGSLFLCEGIEGSFVTGRIYSVNECLKAQLRLPQGSLALGSRHVFCERCWATCLSERDSWRQLQIRVQSLTQPRTVQQLILISRTVQKLHSDNSFRETARRELFP